MRRHEKTPTERSRYTLLVAAEAAVAGLISPVLFSSKKSALFLSSCFFFFPTFVCIHTHIPRLDKVHPHTIHTQRYTFVVEEYRVAALPALAVAVSRIFLRKLSILPFLSFVSIFSICHVASPP